MKRKTETITIRDTDLLRRVRKIQLHYNAAFPAHTVRRVLTEGLRTAEEDVNTAKAEK